MVLATTEDSLVLLAVAVSGYWIFKFSYRLFLSPISNVPGPFFARTTILWQLWFVWKGDYHNAIRKAHNKYGPFVRVNYREVSVCNDQAARKILYPALDKGAWYKIFAMPDSSYVNYMSQLNAKKCLVLGKKITKGYSLNTVLGFEDRIDYAINLFKFGFDKACARGSVSLNEWFAYLTFDVVSLATFSKEFGFLRAEKDIGGSIANSEKLLWYLAIMGYFTKVHDWLEAFMLPLMKWFDLQPMRHVMGTTEKALKAREGIEEAGRDMLSHWKSQKEGNRLTDRDVFGLASTNVAAGGDTVGAESQAFVYYMLRNPDKLLKLREEIDKAASEGRISNPVQYKEALALPYFQACLKELYRVHPVVPTGHIRIAPPEGVEFDGQFFPQGTQLSISSWAMHYDTDNFGDDAHVFRPERWLEDGHTELEKCYLPFSGGYMMCPGRHLAQVTMSKFLTTFFLDYDVELETPEKEWKLLSAIIVKPHSWRAIVKRRLPVQEEKEISAVTY